MKPLARNLSVLTFLVASGHGAADVIYSGLLDTPIPTTFDGVTVVVNGGTINPFMGGKYLANDAAFQPARLGTDGLDTIQNFSAGKTISGSLNYAVGSGGSMDHLGSSFADGSQGYLGFKIHGNYGWMRVVFTNDTAGALIKDWAYDTSGTPIATGNMQQSETGQPVTLDSALGSFTVGSEITGDTSLVKTGANSATLTGTNSYTGSTTVAGGTLLVNGSITGAGTVAVDDGAALGGTGSIGGTVTVDGTLSPGASIAKLTVEGDLTLNNGSTFAYEMNSGALPGAAGDLQVVHGDLIFAKAEGDKVYLTLGDLAGVAFTPNTTTLSLIQYAGSFNGGFFTYVDETGSNELLEGETFTAGLNTWTIHYGASEGGPNFATDLAGSHFINLTNNLTSIPEPGSLLALGCLMGSGMFMRSRKRPGTNGFAYPSPPLTSNPRMNLKWKMAEQQIADDAENV